MAFKCCRALIVSLLLAVSHTALASAFSYCNWSGCNGEVQGGTWCNKNQNRCEIGCGGSWCGESSSPTPLPPTEGAGYCNWNNCNGEVQGGPWCNENGENCVVGCGPDSVWCSGAPTLPTDAPTAAPTTAPTVAPTEAPTTAAPTASPTEPSQATPPTDGAGYCNWNNCNGEAQGGSWCNDNHENCVVGCGPDSVWCPSAPTAPTEAPTSAPSPPPGSGTGNLKATHFWDCSGAACDAKTLQPWDPDKYRYSAMYAPLDPAKYPGGAVYGEKMWMTGAASDTLSAVMGADDVCCGQDSEDIGGCGKCLLVTNPSAIKSDWKAVVMKKNRCPPWATGCDQAHMDIAVPGYDNLDFSLSNICGDSDTIISKTASSSCGDWYERASSTITGCDCSALPDSTEHEAMLKDGCKLFSEWGWTSGNPILEFEVVDCPSEFKSVISQAFGPDGPIY